MTDETKKLFDAPWEVGLEKRGSFYRPCVVSSDTKIASVCTKENANRFARLPDLYDSLVEMTYDYCRRCFHELSFEKPPKPCEFVERGCPKVDRSSIIGCRVDFHWRLLKKVRDGE